MKLGSLWLARGTERGLKAIEEAALLQDLSTRYSLRTLALRLGRDVSWVSRRLSLYRALPEELFVLNLNHSPEKSLFWV